MRRGIMDKRIFLQTYNSEWARTEYVQSRVHSTWSIYGCYAFGITLEKVDLDLRGAHHDTVLVSTPWRDNLQFSSTISPPHIDGNLASSAFERRTVIFSGGAVQPSFRRVKIAQFHLSAENRSLQGCSSTFTYFLTFIYKCI